MLIKYAPPVEGRRELMCKTDEARVSRIRAPFSPYDSMVERVQAVAAQHKGTTQNFGIFHRRTPVEGFDKPALEIAPRMLAYHVLKFLALRAGMSLAGKNLVNARELRVFRRDGNLCTAMYSDFVDDGNGVIERRGRAMREYYASSLEERAVILKKADMLEHQLNPRLKECARNVQVFTGIRIPHPESNYHLSGGETVFFEACGIDIRRAATVASKLGFMKGHEEAFDIRHAIEAVSAIWAIAAKLVARNIVRRKAACPDGILQISRLKMADIYDVMYEVTNYGLHCGQDECISNPEHAAPLGLEHWIRKVGQSSESATGYMHARLGKIIGSRVVALLEREEPLIFLHPES
jgi:hypothetical protein